MVAEWWKTDPETVENWDMVDFANREEYMLMQLYLSIPPKDRKPKKEPWQGSKR